MSVQAYQQYQRTQTETASPGELVPVRMEEAHPYDLVGRIVPS